MEYYDIIVIGAGLSGIDAAYRLKTQLPDASFTVLEARDKIGGTWSYFKFPGIRSDSQLTLFGLPWRPWLHEKDIADAPLIIEYIESAARDEKIYDKIQFQHRMTAANWSSDEQMWTLDVNARGIQKKFFASFLFVCSGYYNYNKPLQVEIPGIRDFNGIVAHPQFWPDNLNWAGKRVVLIGSGATAITMLPVLAKTAQHVTMLQRSPSYVISLDSVSPLGTLLKRFLPVWLAVSLNWWRCFLAEQMFVYFNLTFPKAARKLLMFLMKRELPSSVPVDVHFNPRYDPFDQRLCICPDGDFFKALHRDNCDVVTDVIDHVTEDGVVLKSGSKLEADIIVTATGLHVHLLGGVTPTADGVPVEISKSFVWRGCMLTGVPNAGAVIGYTTNSWTLGADMSIKMLIRVYKYMKKMGATSVVPVMHEPTPVDSYPVVSHSSTYFTVAEKRLPRVLRKSPFYGRVNPVYDAFKLWFGSITNGMLYTVPSSKKDA